MEQQKKPTDAAATPSEVSGGDPSEKDSTPEASPKPAKPPAKPTKRAADRAKKTSSPASTGTLAKGSMKPKSGGKPKPKPPPNGVREARIERMMSKAELARRAGLSVLTIDRVEKGLGCRMDTKRKILEALGLSLADRVRVFGEEE